MKHFLFLKCFLCVILAAAGMAATAQEMAVSGIVRDADGLGLPGVSVAEKGTSNAAVSSVDGTFSLRLQKSPATLLFTYVGCPPAEVKVNAGDSGIDVVMKDDVI